MRKKILFICNVDWFFLSHRLSIGMEAISKGYEVHLATTFSTEKKFFEEKGFITHHLNIDRSQKNLINLIGTFLKILKLILNLKPDLVHSITIKPIVLGGLAVRFFKNISFVASISGLGYVFISKGMKAELRKILVKIIYKIAFTCVPKKVIFQNLDDQKFIQKICQLKEEELSLIPGSGVNLSEYNPKYARNDKSVILFASRLLKSKGICEFVESAKYFRTSKYKFVIAGKMDYENPDCISKKYLESFVSDGYVEYVGYKPDIKDLLRKTKIVVLPSYYGEGLPKILIEAAAFGIPVITTNQPGCRDAIISGETGLIVPVKNSVELCNSLSSLINNDELCKNMGEKARKLALEKYDIRKVVKTHMKIYEELFNYL